MGIGMIQLIKYLKGYVIIRVSGYSPERFMNLCKNRGILLWDVYNCGDCYRMCVSVSGFFRLKSCLRKTKTRAAIKHNVLWQKCTVRGYKRRKKI